MCLCPITIKNPYYRLGGKGINYLHNTHDSHIQVPCGQCRQCVATRQNFFLQRVQMESLRSDLFFFTLTYNDEHLPKIHIGEYDLAYPDITHVQNMFKRVRKLVEYPLRYIVVSEYGSRSHRPHFHGLLSVPKQNFIYNYHPFQDTLYNIILQNWSVNVGSRTRPKYEPLCTHVKNLYGGTFDFHFVEPVPNHDNDVAYYVSKYITKYDDYINKLIRKIRLDSSVSPEDTSFLISKLKPRLLISKDFGDRRYPAIKDYILKCIEKNSEIPSFYDLYTGKQMLLAPYYRKLVPVSYRFEQFYNLRNSYNLDSFVLDDDLSDYEHLVNDLSSIQKNDIKKLQKKLENTYK